MPGFVLIAGVLLAVSFFSVQLIGSRRWLLVPLILGIAIPLAGRLNYAANAPHDLGALPYAMLEGLCWSIGYGLVTGSITRWVLRSVPPPEGAWRWIAPILAFAAALAIAIQLISLFSSPY